MEVSNHIYKFFAEYIYSKSGITYLERDYYRLDTRFKELLEFFELQSVDDLYRKYKENITPDMHAVLINFSTNNETFFFRDNKPFKALCSTILPAILETSKFGAIKIWSCASSTGQEPISILLKIKEKLGDEVFARISLKATDISTDALDKAKSGIYNGLDVQRGLPVTSLMKYFEQQEDENWKINNDILSKINYGEFNLLTGSFPKAIYDVIFCRNVLIYQTKENKEAILRNLHGSIKVGGYVVLGNGESLIGMSLDYERETIDGLTVYKRVK